MLSTLHRSFVSLLLFLFSSLSNWTFADPQQHIQNIHSLKGSRKFLVRNCTFIQLLRHKFFFDLNFLFHAIFFLFISFSIPLLCCLYRNLFLFFSLILYQFNIFIIIIQYILLFGIQKTARRYIGMALFSFFTFCLLKKDWNWNFSFLSALLLLSAPFDVYLDKIFTLYIFFFGSLNLHWLHICIGLGWKEIFPFMQ